MNRTYASIFILLFLVVLLRLFPNYTVKIEKHKVLILYNSMVLDPVLIKLDVLLHNFFFFFLNCFVRFIWSQDRMFEKQDQIFTDLTQFNKYKFKENSQMEKIMSTLDSRLED